MAWQLRHLQLFSFLHGRRNFLQSSALQRLEFPLSLILHHSGVQTNDGPRLNMQGLRYIHFKHQCLSDLCKGQVKILEEAINLLCRSLSDRDLFGAHQIIFHMGHKFYDLFGNGKPGDKDFRKAWKEMEEDTGLWTGSDEDEDKDKDKGNLDKEIKKFKKEAQKNANLIDADDSDELRSVWSGSDEEKTLWTESECDDDDDIPTEAHPNERSDEYIDKLFEFEETPKYRTIAELLKAEKEPKELSPGKQARKLAVENALKKLKKGPDGRYINVWEVMSDIDILIGAFENIISGPEYAELREGGPKKLNVQFFKDIQARMRDPNFKFSPELKLKPKRKLVSRKKWQKTQSRQRKAKRR